MKNGLVIADSGLIFSLAVIDKLDLLELLFNDIKIPGAVWDEITFNENPAFYNLIVDFFKDKVVNIQGHNELSFVMDYGESEAVILYRKLEAHFLLIDNKKARKIAENFGINCIGTIGLLTIAKDKGYLNELKPIFETLLDNKRYYSIPLLNFILQHKNEESINR